MSRREEIAAERKASANFERRRQERHAREAAAIEAKRAKMAGTTRRVPFDDDKAWIKVTNAPPAAPVAKPSRFKAVIDDAAQRSVAERVGRVVAGGTGFPIFGPAPELGPGAGAVGPFPAGPRREATPYSGGAEPRQLTAQERRATSPAAEEWARMRPTDGTDALSDYYRGRVASGFGQGPPLPIPTPAEEWARMHPQGGGALSDYYSAQAGSPQARRQAEEDAAYRMTAEYRNRKLERLRQQGERAADYRMSDEYARKKAARVQADQEREAMEWAIREYLQRQGGPGRL